MCIRLPLEELENFGTSDFIVYNAGQLPCNRYTYCMTSSTSVDLNLAMREMVNLCTQYAREMKKGLFSVTPYVMPLVSPYYCQFSLTPPELERFLSGRHSRL
ncbi:hypothetical protein PVL29_001256 [Vitis rotundifolia]|uniref:Uncharacterized protein n=1 Tax=Vitis rotundifolia TaxID=103349 RepID=A0AA39AL53_VITRO|nr:hypothetical protein PVL29_001256 [Vitis rotundifolia]